jgi:N utilization substance protein B
VKKAKAASPKYRPVKRSAARLGAVQALYQMDVAQTDVGEVVAQFSSRDGLKVDEDEPAAADVGHLTDIVEGTVREQRTIDPQISLYLNPSWPLHRLDTVLRAILRAGAYELMFRHDVPARTAIDEYVNIAHAFYEGEEPGFVNGVLDKLARSLAIPRLQ